MKKQRTNNDGITLIALIITIIVLLILAGVSINLIVGENGILNKAQDAASETKRASIEETIQLEFAGAYDNNGKVDMGTLAEGLLSKGATEVLESGNGIVATFEGINYYVDETGEVIILGSADSEDIGLIVANQPKLSSGMIPIKYNGTSWVICSSDDSEWYSYTKSKKQWANVMLSDGKYDTSAAVGTEVGYDELGSTFVWIPRYAYKITSGYKAKKGSLDIVWLNGTTNEYSSVENKKMVKKTVTASKPTLNEGKTAYTDYVVHPCFTNGTANGFKNGEWDKELSGIWVSKFEGGYPMANNTNDSKAAKTFTVGSDELYYPVFKGRRYSYNYLTVSQTYSMLKEIDGSSNPYGITETADSHLIKNSEWGAVAYLSYSIYGIGNNIEEKEIAFNDVRFVFENGPTSIAGKTLQSITGYSGERESSPNNSVAFNKFLEMPKDGLTDEISAGEHISYIWYTSKGVNASTTGNIYGIYDMVGGMPDRVAAFIDYDESKITNLKDYFLALINDKNTKYVTSYIANNNATAPSIKESFSNWTLENGYFGDGIYEVSSLSNLTKTEYASWYQDHIEAESKNEPCLVRGAYWWMKAAGIFSVGDTTGIEDDYTGGFHAILIGE